MPSALSDRHLFSRSDHTVLRRVLAELVPDLGKAGAAQTFDQVLNVKRMVDDRIRSNRCLPARIEYQDDVYRVSIVELFRERPDIKGKASLPAAIPPLKVREAFLLFVDLVPIEGVNNELATIPEHCPHSLH